MANRFGFVNGHISQVLWRHISFYDRFRLCSFCLSQIDIHAEKVYIIGIKDVKTFSFHAKGEKERL